MIGQLYAAPEWVKDSGIYIAWAQAPMLYKKSGPVLRLGKTIYSDSKAHIWGRT